MGVVIKNISNFFNISKQKPKDETLISTWTSWRNMLQRCHDETYFCRDRYIDVEICPEWKCPINGFVNFYADMGRRPEGTTLDKKIHYSKATCKWSDSETQGIDRHRVKPVGVAVYDGGKAYRFSKCKDGVRYTKNFNKQKYSLDEVLLIADAIMQQHLKVDNALNFPDRAAETLILQIPVQVSTHRHKDGYEEFNRKRREKYALLHQ